MAEPTGTWTITINNGFDSTTDANVIFKQQFFQIKELLKSAGWTVTLSSDGSATAGAGDNITTKDDVGLGINGNGAWVVLSSPSGWADASNTVYMLLAVDTNDASTTPYSQIEGYISTAAYTGGSTSTLPSTAGTVDSLGTSADTIVPGNGSVPALLYTYQAYNSRGDVVYATKLGGTTVFSHLFLVISHSTSYGGGQGNYRFGIYNNAATTYTATGIPSSALSNAAFWIGIDSGGTNADAPQAESALWEAGSSWTAGIDAFGETLDFPMDLFSSIAARGRYLGTCPDIRACPPNLSVGSLDDSETSQTLRKVCVGSLWLYAPTADLPFD